MKGLVDEGGEEVQSFPPFTIEFFSNTFCPYLFPTSTLSSQEQNLTENTQTVALTGEWSWNFHDLELFTHGCCFKHVKTVGLCCRI